MDSNYIKRLYPVSHQQKKKYYEYLAFGPFSFNLLFEYHYETMYYSVMKETVEILCQRHDILRTTYEYLNGEVFQCVHPGLFPCVEIKYIDLIGIKDKETVIRDLKSEISIIKSDLERGPIIHLRFVEFNEQMSGLLFGIHHISADGFSVDLLKYEIDEIYQSLKKREFHSLPKPKYQTWHFSAWVDSFLNSESGVSMKQIYRDRILQNILNGTQPDPPNENSYSAELRLELKNILKDTTPDWSKKIFGNVIHLIPPLSSTYIYYIDKSFLDKLNQLVLRFSCALTTIIIGCFFLLFSEITRIKFVRLCIASSIIRSSDEWSTVVGWLTGEIVMCKEIVVNDSLGNYFKDVTIDMYSSAECQFYPVEELLNDLGYPVSITVPAFLNIRRDTGMIKNFKSAHIESGSASFEFESTITEYNNGICFSTMYHRKAYSSNFITSVFGKYFQILERLTSLNKTDLVTDLLI